MSIYILSFITFRTHVLKIDDNNSTKMVYYTNKENDAEILLLSKHYYNELSSYTFQLKEHKYPEMKLFKWKYNDFVLR